MKTVLGLDLGSSATRAIELAEKKGETKIVNFLSADLPLGRGQSFFSSLENRGDYLSQFLREFVSDGRFGASKVATSLPESVVFTQVVTLPKMSNKELSKAINWEVQQYIPMDLDSVNYDYQIIGDSDGSLNIFLVAVPKKIVSLVAKVIGNSGLELLRVETATQSLLNLPSLAGLSGTTLVVNIGLTEADLGIIRDGNLLFTRGVAFGGDALTKAIAQYLKISEGQAENYKKTYGLSDAELEGKLTRAVQPVLDVLLSELRRSLDFFSSRSYGSSVTRIILTGGAAQLRGLVPFVTQRLGIETALLDALSGSGVSFSDKINRQSLEDASAFYSLALGSALSFYN